MIRFYFEGEKVVQSNDEDRGFEHEFDPKGWALFTRGSRVVHAVKIPRPFRVGADLCKDGYLVWDGERLYAVSAQTFNRDYQLGAARAA